MVGNRAQPKYWLHLKNIAFSEALGNQAAFPSEVFLDTLTITDYQREPWTHLNTFKTKFKVDPVAEEGLSVLRASLVMSNAMGAKGFFVPDLF